MDNQKHIEWLRESFTAKDAKVWNERREKCPFTPNFAGIKFVDALSGCLPLQVMPLRNKGITFTNIDFHGAILTDTDFYDGARNGANLTNVNLREATLTNANLWEADLAEADLAFADLTNTNFINATFKDTNLTGAELWKAKLYSGSLSDISPEQHPDEKPTDKPVKNVGALLKRIQRIEELYKCGEEQGQVQFYFRGECSTDWKLRPSVMRSDSSQDEAKMLVDLASRRPEEFNGMPSALAQWVLAQHHRLETRFLDVTKNPLVALFNACGGSEDEDRKYIEEPGRLHIFAVPPELVKPFTSDTISVIANFARLSQNDQKLILGQRDIKDKSGKDIGPVSSAPLYSRAMLYLYQYVKQEKPYFEERIDPRDLYRVFVVEPQQFSERLRAQSGAFLVSAFHERFERKQIRDKNPGIPVYAHYTLTVAKCKHKASIMKELELLNITKETLFPGLDSSAQAVMQRYRKPADSDHSTVSG